ncbi:MAG: diaminopimelate epimerase [Gammaproteobacteria bacterium]|nr:diaminopimelate epimerase [Gammaproteobacteria bacterium]
MKLKFAKMHGLGNDFAVIDAINQSFEPRPELVRRWADRFDGIGFDQMLIVEKPDSDRAAFKYRIYNADGGEVAQCGNGARCFARFVREQGMTDLDVIPVETNTGLLKLEAVDQTRYRVDMGVPRFKPTRIPLRVETRQNLYQSDYEGREISFSAVSIGNPHMVIQVNDVDRAPVESQGPYFESHMMFPERANIGFMQIVDRQNFKLRVFERGVGETRACGSGACAAMVAGVQLGLLEASATGILRGGELNLEWQGEANPVMMTGETAMVYQGEIEYE